MYKLLLTFIALFLLSCGRNQPNHSKIKSIVKTINDTILEKRSYDKLGKIIFEKNNQIDFGKNSIIFITAYEYDTINHKVFKYYINSSTGLELTIDSVDINSTLREKKISIYDFNDKKALRKKLYEINEKEKFIDFFKTIYPKNFKPTYTYSYTDTVKTNIVENIINDTIIIETNTTKGNTIEYSKQFLDNERKKLKEIVRRDYQNIELFYNEREQIILQKEQGQYYKFYYQGNILIKKEMYHGNSLAFIEDYIYDEERIIIEIKTRVTESIYFKDIPKYQTIEYHYEFYN